MQQRFDKIEEELKKVFPHVKEISANGQGELFASKRTLKMLSEWKPLAPAKECKVSLETNGSLFDEEHWKQIENLGQYNLSVSVTVMSFDEYTYQQLSGVRYPISRIENNLRFIKSLREKGIINYLELATVVQERNFRQLPDFTRRCIEEFGADEVRLRYFLPWGKYSADIEWFADVRNPYHPQSRILLPTILIGGGYDKGNDYDEWIESFGDTIKLLVLIGQTRQKIAECCDKHGFSNYVFKDTYEEALEFCTESAQKGDAVLLSPACASWDMFPNYETRGKRFKDYVNKLSD